VTRRLRSPLAVVAVAVAAAVGVARLRGTPTHQGGAAVTSSAPGNATVERVVDGDTIIVRVGGQRDRVRLIGIDTPESVKPGTPVQCFAHEASEHTKSLLPPSSAVRLVRDVEARDRYGRLLAYVYREPDGLFVNLALARDGYATTLTYPPNVAHTDEFVKAVAAARQANRGLWAHCDSAHSPLPSGG